MSVITCVMNVNGTLSVYVCNYICYMYERMCSCVRS
jgi:hypothetical protein